MTVRLLSLALVLLALAGCGPAAPPAKPLVVATIYPLWEFARQVAGDRAEVVSLVPAGVEPHDWEPAPRDVSQIQRAAVFVHTGTGLDGWAEKLLADLTGRRGVVVNARGGLGLLTVGGVTDPHVWLDPTLARVQVLAIAGGLELADPAGHAVYAENVKAFIARLDALDLEFAAGLADCARREIVTSHAAYAYLARRYRLTQVPVMGLAPEAEPSPADLAAIVRTARRLKVTHVFYETLVSPRLAETLSREIGATPLPLNPIEGMSPAEAAAGTSYLELMRANLANLRTALGCR
ncbi:MAG TPA: zinc ABC transporter substrate-binding protein [Methylomirabilota bacterium]|nr:zinc ABC transporter substrate-binding protein [Methylomirabilota bacterium]